MDSFEGKVAVVTGGASGIGLALARRFGSEGMKVVVADVEADALDAAVKSLGDELGADAVLGVPTDVRDPDAVDALRDATFERFGTAHVVCNNAGVAVGGLIWTIPADRWRWIVDVNLLGVVNGIRSFVPRMVEQGEGHVVNTASVAGHITAPAMGPYTATKHAVVALTETLFLDLQLAGNGVGASVLCPEWVRTRIHEAERNRPDEVDEMAVPGEDTPAVGIGDVLQGLIQSGMDPADVADKVLDAITTGRFWIFTHDTSLAAAKRRWAAIESDATPVMWNQP
jgi:NAD(P)-dependent dehydrogenase (short-subunit alcohol dehydrogenase family)